MHDGLDPTAFSEPFMSFAVFLDTLEDIIAGEGVGLRG